MNNKFRSMFLLAASGCLLLSSFPAYADEVFMPGFAPPARSTASMADLIQQIQSNPNAVNFKKRAEAYRQLGQHKEAVDDLNQAINIEPKDVYSHLLKGEVFFEEGMFPESVSNCDSAIKIDPKFSGSYALRARGFLRMKDYSKALDDANTILKLSANSAVAFLLRGAACDGLRKYSNAVDDCTEAIKGDPKLAKAYYYRAVAYQKLEQYQKAVDDYTQAINLEPGYRPALLGRAWSNYSLSKDAEALSDCSRAVKFNNAADLQAFNKYVGEKSTDANITPDPDFNLGAQLEDDLKNALTLYADVLKDKPNDPDALRDRGIVYMHLSKFHDASRDFEVANKGLPLNPAEFSGVGSEDDYNAAKPEYKLGNQDLANADYKSAVSHYRAALQKYPQYARCWHNLAIACGALDDNYDAELCCIHAISYRPDDWKLWDTLGAVLFHEYQHDKGDPNKLNAAAQALHQSLSLKPESESDKEGIRQMLASVKSYERALAPVMDFVITTMPIN